jgi:hypothetical protein
MVNMINSTIVEVTLSGGATAGGRFQSSGLDPNQPGPAYVPGRDCIVFPCGNNNVICVDVSGVNDTGTGTAMAHYIAQSGTACPSLWNNLGYGPQSIGGLEYCSYDGNLWALNQFNGTTVAQLFKLTPPTGALSGTWTWSNESLTSTNGEALALRNSSPTTIGDISIMGRFRFVPALKSFVWSDAKDLRVQMGRPSSFT